MTTKLLKLVVAAAALLAACKKKAPENIPQPKAEPAAEQSAEKPPETAAGNYLRREVGHIQEAKDAKALYEKSAQETLGAAADLDGTGGK